MTRAGAVGIQVGQIGRLRSYSPPSVKCSALPWLFRESSLSGFKLAERDDQPLIFAADTDLRRSKAEGEAFFVASREEFCGVVTLSILTLLLRSAKWSSLERAPMATAAIWIALASGCRIGELLKARWEHIDFINRKWLIPAENSKNGSPLEIYLSDFALLWFRTLEQHRHNEWLYPARNKAMGDSHTCTKSITKQIGDRQRSNDPMKNRTSQTNTLTLPGGPWTPHDLRRTASTIMGDLGIKPEVIDRCQNHKEENRVRRTYQRYSYQSEMKEAWQLLGARLEGLTSAKEIAKVIPLRKSA